MSTDSLSFYLDEIGRYPLLTAFQEIELSRQIKRMIELRDRENKTYTKTEQRAIKIGLKAKEKLTKHNLRLVVYICRKFCNKMQAEGLDIGDFIQEGSLGLARACETFDGTKGYKFSTYAYWWIKQALRRAYDNKARIIRLPVHATEKILAIKRFTEAYRLQHSRSPSFAEIAAEIGMSEAWVKLLMDRCRTTTSLDLLLKDSELQLIETVADPRTADRDEVYCQIDSQEFSDNLSMSLSLLPERERQVLVMRYALEPGTEEATLDLIGKRLGFCRERSRQILKQATNRLRMNLAGQHSEESAKKYAAA